MFIEINNNYEDVSERSANDTSCRQVSQRSDSECGRSDTSESDSSPDEPSPACRVDAVQVEEPVGCDARVYSDHSPTSSHSRWEIDDL